MARLIGLCLAVGLLIRIIVNLFHPMPPRRPATTLYDFKRWRSVYEIIKTSEVYIVAVYRFGIPIKRELFVIFTTSLKFAKSNFFSYTRIKIGFS